MKETVKLTRCPSCNKQFELNQDNSEIINKDGTIICVYCDCGEEFLYED